MADADGSEANNRRQRIGAIVASPAAALAAAFDPRGEGDPVARARTHP
jgi:hypothetical protein